KRHVMQCAQVVDQENIGQGHGQWTGDSPPQSQAKGCLPRMPAHPFPRAFTRTDRAREDRFMPQPAFEVLSESRRAGIAISRRLFQALQANGGQIAIWSRAAFVILPVVLLRESVVQLARAERRRLLLDDLAD